MTEILKKTGKFIDTFEFNRNPFNSMYFTVENAYVIQYISKDKYTAEIPNTY